MPAKRKCFICWMESKGKMEGGKNTREKLPLKIAEKKVKLSCISSSKANALRINSQRVRGVDREKSEVKGRFGNSRWGVRPRSWHGTGERSNPQASGNSEKGFEAGGIRRPLGGEKMTQGRGENAEGKQGLKQKKGI